MLWQPWETNKLGVRGYSPVPSFVRGRGDGIVHSTATTLPKEIFTCLKACLPFSDIDRYVVHMWVSGTYWIFLRL